jgi:hypothetical protein
MQIRTGFPSGARPAALLPRFLRQLMLQFFPESV